MNKINLLITTISFLLLSVSGFCQKTNSGYVDDEIMVQLSDPIAIDRLVSDYNAFGLFKKHTVSKRFNIYLLQFDNSNTSNQSLIRAIKRDRSVVHVQNNHYVSLRGIDETTPNDSLFGDQWALHNFGQGGGIADADINAKDAWDITTGGLTASGDTIVIAIVDGGSDIYHQDLDHWINYAEIGGNGIDDDTNGYIDDKYGWNAFDHNGSIPFHQHGTHVSGIAGARGNNSIGVTGVNWNVKILPVAGGSSNESIVIEALSYVYVVRERYNQTGGLEGAFVVVDNCSFGVNEGQPEDYPIWEAMYDSLGELGILSIGATANANLDVDKVGDIPTAFSTPYMISVTNTNNKDEKYANAAYGDTTIDLGAPGTTILSTRINNAYGNSSGTSMSAPHVAGAVALLISGADSTFMVAYKNNPGASVLQIKEHILNGVDTIEDLVGKTVTGGRLNVFNSLNLLLNAPSLSVDKDSVYKMLLIGSEEFETLKLSNTGGDTINYSITMDGNPEWLNLSQNEGTLPSLASDEINITFYSTGLDTGVYQTTIKISADNIATRYIPVNLVVYTDVGIYDQSKIQPKVNVFPNPFTSTVNFSIDETDGEAIKIDIYDQSGKKVFNALLVSRNNLCSTTWKTEISGIYFYLITRDGRSLSSGKLIHL